MKRIVLLSAKLLPAALLSFVVMAAQPAHAVPCGGAAGPTCDGECPPGLQCVDLGYPGPVAGVCDCVPASGPCGSVEGPPLCYGECPPGESCFDKGMPIGCECDIVPTLSEWGIMGMSVLMLGAVIYLRRRRQTVL